MRNAVDISKGFWVDPERVIAVGVDDNCGFHTVKVIMDNGAEFKVQDPDYVADDINKEWCIREAQALAERICKLAARAANG